MLVERIPNWQQDPVVLEQLRYQQQRTDAGSQSIRDELAFVYDGFEIVIDTLNTGFEKYLAEDNDQDRNQGREEALRGFFQWIAQQWWINQQYAETGAGKVGDSELAMMLWDAIGPQASAGGVVFADVEDEFIFDKFLELEDAAVDFMDKLVYRRRGPGLKAQLARSRGRLAGSVQEGDRRDDRRSPRGVARAALGEVVNASEEAVRKALQRNRGEERKKKD
jgi:hypothetical protein